MAQQSIHRPGRGTRPRRTCPGCCSGVKIHDGPPHGAGLTRVAIIQNHAARTWAVTAAGDPSRHRDGRRPRAGPVKVTGSAELLDVASRTELIDELLFMVRTVPDDGAERDLWITQHRHAGSPGLSRQVNDDLHRA